LVILTLFLFLVGVDLTKKIIWIVVCIGWILIFVRILMIILKIV
jgi:hypothetical protein